MTGHRLLGALLLFAAAMLAAVGTVWPMAYGACGLIVGLGCVVLGARRFPRGALVGCVYAVLLAGTKFRQRSATASLSASIDGQIVLELALYAGVALTLAVVISTLRLRFTRLRRTEMLLLAYVVLASASVAWSSAPAMTLARAVQLAIVLVTALVLVRVNEPRDALRTLATPLISYVAICAGIAAIVPQARSVIYEGDIPRYAWFALHPIAVASVTGIGLVFLTERLTDASTRQSGMARLGLVLLAIAFIAIALLTRARGPLVAMLAGVSLVLVGPRIRPVTLALATSALAIGLFVLETSDTNPVALLREWSSDGGVVASVVFRNQEADQVAGFSGRGELWAGVLPLVMERPLIGLGYQGSREALLETMPWAGYAHNSLMQSLLDLGITGSLMLFFAFGSAFIVGSLRGSAINPEVPRARLLILAVCIFELLNGVSDEVFAGAPGYQTLLVLACVCLATRLRENAAGYVETPQSVWQPAPILRPTPSASQPPSHGASEPSLPTHTTPSSVDASGA